MLPSEIKNAHSMLGSLLISWVAYRDFGAIPSQETYCDGYISTLPSAWDPDASGFALRVWVREPLKWPFWPLSFASVFSGAMTEGRLLILSNCPITSI